MEKIFICIKNIGVWHSFEKMKPQLCFFLKKPFLVKVAFCENATIEYLLDSLCASVFVCVCVFVCFCTITQKEIDLGT